MRLIDADALQKAMEIITNDTTCPLNVAAEIDQIIDYAPTIELNEVWVITGEDQYGDKIVLGIARSIEEAENASAYYESKDYADVSYAPFKFKTYNTIPLMWIGYFSLTLIPYQGYENTYLMKTLNYSLNKKFIDGKPEDYEDFDYIFKHTINSNGHIECSISGDFCSATEPPPSLPEKQLREWLRDKINAKGQLKVVVPSFD